MSRSPEIRPVLEEGIDRKTLAQLRDRFLWVNARRLERALQAMPGRQQRVLKLLPLLFHVNHPLFPGYVSGQTPAGLHGFEPDADVLAEASSLCRAFTYKESRARAGSRPQAPWQIHGLFLMGSLGTLAQAERSDLDVWVCHDPELKPALVAELERKCDLLSAWAASQGAEAHFFLIDPQRFASGERNERLTAENCGSSQHYLLLDEFYRTAIWLGGRLLLWWLVPAYEEHRYQAYATALLEKRFVPAEEVLDLGHLGRIPPEEFLGAGLWQLYKGIGSPYKAILKLLLTEVYASEHPQLQCLAHHYKEAVYANRLDLDELDPYLMVYRRLEAYLRERQEAERLELVRRSLYLKVEKKLSRPPTGTSKSWQRLLLERLTWEWGWAPTQLAQLDERGQWKVDVVSRERRALVGELVYSFRFLSQFARQQQVGSPLDSRDLAILGRQLYAAYERKAGKVELINPGISLDMGEEALTLVATRDEQAQRVWSLYRGNLSLRQCEDYAPLKRAREPVALLAWGYRNGAIEAATRWSLHPGDSDLCETELAALLGSLRQFLPLPLPAACSAALLAPARSRQILLLANVGLDPAAQPGDLHLGDDPAAENRIFSIDQLMLNSWNELFVSRFEGAEALIEALQAYLQHSRGNDGAPPELQVRCHCRNRDPFIARRLEELCGDVQRALGGGQDARYLLHWHGVFHVLEARGAQVRHLALGDLGGLLAYLEVPRPVSSPLRVDRLALAGHELKLILPLGDPQCIQVFYRIDGAQADLYVLDEGYALWHQRLPFRDPQTLLTPLWRFLQSVLFRRAAQLPLDGSEDEHLDVTFHEILAPEPGQPLTMVRRNPPQGGPANPYYDVQAIIQPSEEEGGIQVALYCNQREFTQLEYGSGLYLAAARHILGQRVDAQRYPCYLSDLDIAEATRDGRIGTVRYLRYKSRLEAALNQALGQLG